MYNNCEKKTIEKFIKKNFGKIKTIIKEAIEITGIDIALVSPTKDMPYYKLVTIGMGDYSMNLPHENQDRISDRTELCFYLHESWKVDEIAKTMKYGWPVEVLKKLASYPKNTNTWIAHGHSFNNNSRLCDFVNYTGILILSAISSSSFIPKCKISDKKEVGFLLCYPIYKEELDFKNNNSALDLINIIDDSDFPVVKNERFNYCVYGGL